MNQPTAANPYAPPTAPTAAANENPYRFIAERVGGFVCFTQARGEPVWVLMSSITALVDTRDENGEVVAVFSGQTQFIVKPVKKGGHEGARVLAADLVAAAQAAGDEAAKRVMGSMMTMAQDVPGMLSQVLRPAPEGEYRVETLTTVAGVLHWHFVSAHKTAEEATNAAIDHRAVSGDAVRVLGKQADAGVVLVYESAPSRFENLPVTA